MTRITESQLYEVIFRNPPSKDRSNSLRIKHINITCGELHCEYRTEDRRTCSEELTASSDILIYPGCHGVVRAFPSRNAVATRPAGSFSVETATGVANYQFPWDAEPPSGLPGIDEYKSHSILYPDVLIVGSGPLGATYARKILTEVDQAVVLMVEMGAQESMIVGEHKRNTVAYQRDMNSFVHVIKGALSPLSVPVKKASVAHPWPWGLGTENNQSFVQNGQNPDQDPHNNLGGCAATRVVGGMATHWTCSTPRQQKGLERSEIFTDEEWDSLYTEAEGYLGTSRDQFEGSLRHQLVKRTLKSSFERLFPGREVLSLPLACKRSTRNPSFVTWAAPNTILGKTVDKLHVYPDHQCTKLLMRGGNVSMAVVKDLSVAKRRIYISASKFVVCGGAILTPQILYNSGFRAEPDSLPALGRYMTHQPMTFCQVILHEHLVASVKNSIDSPEWLSASPELQKKLIAHRCKHPEDPLPFPFDDPEPQVTAPVCDKYPWHTQIHREPFLYGDVAPNVDSRLVVDLRWFGMVEVDDKNRVEFSNTYHDQYNMPQPTFHCELQDPAKLRCHQMMADMIRVSLELGRYVPSSEPQFAEPGVHVCGTTRAGDTPRNSVVDKESKVWGVGNLWLGGNGVIPTKSAANPTLTSICFAIRGADTLISELEQEGWKKLRS